MGGSSHPPLFFPSLLQVQRLILCLKDGDNAEVLAPYLIEQVKELQIPILFDQVVDALQLVKIEQLVDDQAIDLIIAAGRLPLVNKLLTQLSLPIFLTKHPVYSKRKTAREGLVHDLS